MASKTRYTEEFKKKVVEEYKKGDLSLEEGAVGGIVTGTDTVLKTKF